MDSTKIFLLTLIFLTSVLKAQQSRSTNWTGITRESITDSTDLDPLFLAVGTEYTSLVVFCGRTFGENELGISPFLFLNSGVGFYGYVISNYWSATVRKPARIVSGVGYQYAFNRHVSFYAGYERWFNRFGDDYFDRALQNEIEIGANLFINKLSIEPAFYYMFGLERISQLDLSIERNCPVISKNIRVSVRPSFVTSFATPVFSYIYYEFPDEDYDYEKFRLVDFEGALSLYMELGNLELNGAFRYNYPISVGNETLTPFLYFTADISYSF